MISAIKRATLLVPNSNRSTGEKPCGDITSCGREGKKAKVALPSIITACCIPTTERLRVLEALDGYKLNAFSLFGSEESLMETFTFRELLFPEKDL